ncbi:MAG: hypothetical protein AAF600_11325 [Bacteroidota bacterium]
MVSTVNKDLISQLLKLESDQQEKVLAYIKNMLVNDEMNRRAELSEKAIAEGRTKSFNEFNADFEQWKIQKRSSMT